MVQEPYPEIRTFCTMIGPKSAFPL